MKYRRVNKVTKVNKRIMKGPSSSFVKFFGSSSRNRLVLKQIKYNQDCFTLIGQDGLTRHFQNPGIAKKRICLTHDLGGFDNVFKGPT